MDEHNSSDLTPPEQSLGAALRARGWTLVTAESCTGGLIGHMITQIPGSSDYYLGGVVSYSDELKRQLLEVPAATLDGSGAVSEPTARAMLRGVRRLMSADTAIAVTGIAGPGGGSAEKPVGLTWLGVATPGGERVERFQFEGDRATIKLQAAQTALQLLLEQLTDE